MPCIYFEIKNDSHYYKLTSSYFDKNKNKVKNSSKSSAKILVHKKDIVPFVEYLIESDNENSTLLAFDLFIFYKSLSESNKKELELMSTIMRKLKEFQENPLPNLVNLDKEIDDLQTLVVQTKTTTQNQKQKDTKKEENKKGTGFFGLFNTAQKTTQNTKQPAAPSLTQQHREQDVQIGKLQEQAQQLRKQADKAKKALSAMENEPPIPVTVTPIQIPQATKSGKIEQPEKTEPNNDKAVISAVIAEIKNQMPQWRKDDKNKNWFISSYLEIVRVTVYPDKKSKNKKVTYNYYLVNKREKLGKGAFGVVYKSYPIDEKNNVNLKKPFVLKIYKDAKDLDEVIEDAVKEERYSRGHYLTEMPLVVNNQVYYFMEFIPGEELKPRNPKFKNLSLFERVDIAAQLIDQLHLTHNNTPSTGAAAVHADLKFENIRIDIPTDKNLPIRARIIDYGIADNISDNPNIQTSQDVRGTPLYMSPDAWNGEFSAKTDMFTFFILFIFLMGGDPLRIRELFARNNYKDPNLKEKTVNTEIYVDEMFTGIIFPASLKSYEDVIKRAITILCKRGVSLKNHQERPNSTETQVFLNILRKLVIPQNRLDSNDRTVCVAKLNLIAADLWDAEIDEQTSTTCARFDFEEHSQVCEAINLLQNLNLLRAEYIKILLHEDCVYALLKLNTSSFLNENILNKLAQNPGDCKKVMRTLPTHSNLLLLDSRQQKQFFQSKSRKTQISIFKELLRDRINLVAIWGQNAVSNLQQSLGGILTAKNSTYFAHKKDLDPDGREGKWSCFGFGYNNGDKADSAELLIKTVTGVLPVAAFFSEDNKIKRAALMESFSESKNMSADLVECLQSAFTP